MSFLIIMTISAPVRVQNSSQFKITVNHPKFFMLQVQILLVVMFTVYNFMYSGLVVNCGR